MAPTPKKRSNRLTSKSVNLPINNLLGDSPNDSSPSKKRLKLTSYNAVLNQQNINKNINNKSTKNNNSIDEIVWSNPNSRTKKKSLSSPSQALTNDENENIFDRNNHNKLPDFRVNPISLLERKYNTNFNVNNPGQDLEELKKLSSNNLNTLVFQKNKSKSINITSSKLFNKLDQRNNSDQNSHSDSLKQLLNELQNDDKKEVNLGNTTSELLDKGITINNYEFDNFDDEFFDENVKNKSILNDLKYKLDNKSGNNSVQPKIENNQVNNNLEPENSKLINNNQDFDDEFSSDDDDVFQELEEKLNNKNISIKINENPITMSFNNVIQSTPTKQKSLADDEFSEDFSDDFDDDEEQKLLNKSTQSIAFTTQQKNDIIKKDLVGADIFSKKIQGDDDSNDLIEYKDPLDDVNLAKIAIERKWFHRFQILEIMTKTYNSKGQKKNQLILKVKDKNAKVRNIVIRDSWITTDYEVGEIIHVIGDNPSVVDSQKNLIILNPDTLISATTLGESISCERKSSLSARFRSPGESSKPLIVGNIIHELLQTCMVENKLDDEFIDDFLKTKIDSFIIDILSISETEESVLEECHKHTGYIKIFIKKYCDTSNLKKEDFKITKILDVEENIWSPIFGLRGLMDVTIESTINNKGKFISPLEIKTGKEYISHNAQTSLYTLLMRDRYEMDINFYFLLYTKFSKITKYEINNNDLRMLLIKRNNISKFLKSIQTKLPPLVKNSTCDFCYQKDLCVLYNKIVEDGKESDNSFKPGEFQLMTDHISTEYKDFYKYWEDLINKEENFVDKLTKEIWLFNGEERELNNGKSICHLKILSVDVDEANNQYIYTFKRNIEDYKDFKFPSMIWSQIGLNDSIIISDESGHFAISSGFVVLINEDFIKISTRRQIELSNMKNSNFNISNNQTFKSVLKDENDEKLLSLKTYRIDKNPAFHGLKLARYNLIELFSTNSTSMIRDVLISGTNKPCSIKPIINYNIEEFKQKNFNDDQINAMKKVFHANDFSLILGMPGTGKTTIITEIIQQLIKNDKTILIASYTHSAVDNILLKLKDQGFENFLRLGNYNKIHPLLRSYSPFNKEIKNRDDLNDIYMKPPIIATTCLGITDFIFNSRRFDYCIIDEASQVSMPICLGPLRFCDKFILVGDHYQLPPLIVNPKARKGLQNSLFKLLSTKFPDNVGELTHQYRMCEDIMILSNTLIYNGRLKCGSNDTAFKKLKIPNPDNLTKFLTFYSNLTENSTNINLKDDKQKNWINDIIFKSSNRVIFLNHDNLNAKERIMTDKVDNPLEADLIYQIVEAFLNCGIDESQIGILSLYRAQIRLLKSKLFDKKKLDILTADKFQGLDKDCIIISLVRSNDKQIVGELLKEWRRINVAITRAKKKLIILGSKNTLKTLPTLNAFLNIIESRGWLYDLPNDKKFLKIYSFPMINNTIENIKKDVKNKTKLSEKLLDNHLLLKNVIESL